MLKRFRVIEQLRKEYGGKWSYSAQEHAWISEDGKRVESRAHITPRTPNGDDDCFTTVYWRTDINPMEQAPVLTWIFRA